MRLVQQVSMLLVAACVLVFPSAAFAADDGAWTVSKSSGEVWLASSGAQPASLKQEEMLKPGDTVRTGRTGRVLLRRGEETMLISPNSVVGMPAESKEGLSTTIVQQAGSILLEVEKRNVKHFEVETPYLAAVVKGTQFSVTVNAGSTKVGVLRGQVEVSDFKTGQIAQVLPGQAATVFEHGKPGLSLSGAGTFNPIEHGKPRASSIERVPVPKSGLSAPRNAANGHAIHALGPIDKGTKAAGALKPSQQAAGAHASKGGAAAKPGVVRISNSLGEVKLNVHKVTHGLAHGGGAPGQVRNAHASTETVWSDSKASTTASNSTVQTAVTTSGAVTAASSGSSNPGAAIAAAAANGTAGDNANSGNGNSGNGNSGNRNSGNGNNGATGNGRGNNGDGNGNGGGNGSNGHGNAFGHNKH